MAGDLGLYFPKFVLLFLFPHIKKAPTALPDADKRNPGITGGKYRFSFLCSGAKTITNRVLIQPTFLSVEIFYMLTEKLNKAGQFFTPKI